MTPEEVRSAATRPVGFVLLSSRGNPIPSTRIACLNLFPLLMSRGYAPVVIWEPATPREVPERLDVDELWKVGRPDIVVFQKVHGPAIVGAIRKLRQHGVRTVWCVCDLVDNLMVSETDATIAVTPFLRSLYQPELQSKISVVHDGIEDETLLATSVGRAISRPSALLVTSHDPRALPVIVTAPHGWRVTVLGRYAHSPLQRAKHTYWALALMKGWHARVQAITGLYDPRIRFKPWSLSTLASEIAFAQVGIIPIDEADAVLAVGASEPAWRVKSENRLTLLMSAGLPVIATPIPSYEAVIEHGYSGYFARTEADWRRFFKQLRDPGLRCEIGARARQRVLPDYSKQRQADRFAEVLAEVSSRHCS